MSSDTQTAAAPALPLFYQDPQVLHGHTHRDLHLKSAADFRFAAKANSTPIMIAEFVEAQQFYPIVFVGERAQPAVVLGLEQRNLFVTPEGAWTSGLYVPAYVRRYPFVFAEAADQSGFALAIDLACERVVAAPEGGEGMAPLFKDGQPTALTQDALNFTAAFKANQIDAQAFCAALVEYDLLVDQQARGAFPGGQAFALEGFRIVDAARLQALCDAVVLDWRRKGWLTLIDFHLASLSRWADLPGLSGQGSSGKADA